MKRAHFSVISILAAVLVAATGAFWAQAQSGEAASYVTGTVVSVSGDKLVVRTESGTQMTFYIDAQSIMPASLSSGARVDVEYHALQGGTYHASEVREVKTAASEGPPATAPPAAQAAEVSEPSEPGEKPSGMREPLPQTASPVVLVGLIGLASLGAGVGLRFLSRRSRR